MLWVLWNECCLSTRYFSADRTIFTIMLLTASSSLNWNCNRLIFTGFSPRGLRIRCMIEMRLCEICVQWSQEGSKIDSCGFPMRLLSTVCGPILGKRNWVYIYRSIYFVYHITTWTSNCVIAMYALVQKRWSSLRFWFVSLMERGLNPRREFYKNELIFAALTFLWLHDSGNSFSLLSFSNTNL